MSDSKPILLSCAEFQEKLPDMFAGEAGDIREQPELRAHLSTCENCSALVRDLEYIADQARLLLQPTLEPSPDVWDHIQSKLQKDGKPN
ncbi:MAG TPA: zf-HC2 domain-containing protein [Acidobacteriaceae bacterium]